MSEGLYDVRVRRDRYEVTDPSAEPPRRRYRDITDEEEAVAVLLSGGSLEVTAVHRQARAPMVAEGEPAGGLYVTMGIRERGPGDEDYGEGGINRVVRVSWGPAGLMTDVLAEETRAMEAVMARAAQLAETADFILRTAWFTRYLENEARAVPGQAGEPS